MPLYGYNCSQNHYQRLFSKIVARDNKRQCEKCGAELLRQFEAPAIKPELSPYQSPITGQWIDSRAARREDLKRSGSIEWEPGIRQDLPSIRQSLLDKQMAPLEATIEETARKLVASGELSPL